jgi:hypothetical protein
MKVFNLFFGSWDGPGGEAQRGRRRRRGRRGGGEKRRRRERRGRRRRKERGREREEGEFWSMLCNLGALENGTKPFFCLALPRKP